MTTNIMQANVGKRAKLGLVNLLLLVLLIESIDVFVKNSISRRDKLTPKNKRGWNTSRKVQVWVIFSDSRVSSYCPTHHFLLGDLWVHFCSNQTGQDIPRHLGKSVYRKSYNRTLSIWRQTWSSSGITLWLSPLEACSGVRRPPGVIREAACLGAVYLGWLLRQVSPSSWRNH